MEFCVEHIQKKFGKKEVLRDISFTAKSGECVGILGGNGCGKSTLLSILSGVQRGDGGRFLCDGKDLFKEADERAKLVGYVPQNTPLIPELSAKDNLTLWYGKKEMTESLHDGVLGMLGIGAFLKVPVQKMSGGMKKRLAIGCAVAHSPDLLLLDEPSAALDLICRERISNYLKEWKDNGGTIILSTHDVGEIELCDRLFIMREGVLHPFTFDGNVHRLVGSLAQ